MGNPILDEWPAIIDEKWYCTHTIRHVNPAGNADCDDPILDYNTCCMSGSILKTKLVEGYECKPFHGICCTPTFYHAEEIEDIEGPYDTLDACNAVCGV